MDTRCGFAYISDMRIVYTILIAVQLVAALSAQSDEQSRKLQIAQSLERSGDWKQATVLYEDLWSSDTTNYVYFDALRRAYAQLKEYGKAMTLLEHRLRMRPSEIFLAAQLGGLYFDAGRREQADSVWQHILRGQPRQRQLYVLVAQQMQTRRLFGRAIETYRAGRTATGNQADFVQELALLHSATQEYGKAVEEYLRLLVQSPHQLGYVQSRIASFTIREEGLQQAQTVVARAVEDQPENVPIHTLYAWVLMERDLYVDALDTYRTIDRLTRSNGAQLFSFAEQAFREGRYTEAIRAYQDIASSPPPAPLRPRALYGMAESYEYLHQPVSHDRRSLSLYASQVRENAPKPDTALMLYANIINEYPGSEPALRSRFRIGVITFNRLFDVDAALRAFDTIRKDRSAGGLTWEAYLMSADVLVAKGDVVGARKILEEAPPQARDHLQERLVLKRAWIEYLLGEHTKAQSMLSEVIQTLTRDGANDGLTLFYHVQEGVADSGSLAMFARGELLAWQRKYSEAFTYFEEVGRTARTALLSSRARIESADMLVLLGQSMTAIELLDSVVATHQSDVLRDRALFRVGTLYEEEIDDIPKAVQTYERFLQLFPTSLYADEARRRVRLLRKDIL
jgi:tetratricopeptide (TPR) repeat protein